MSEDGDAYFQALEAEVEDAYALAERARAKGEDPSAEVEIPIAQDMADRVQNLLGIPGVADRVRELEAEMSREEAALALAEDFASGAVGDAEEPEERIEGAVRTAVALLTEGVVAAPIEGIDGVEIAQNDDGSEFVKVYYAGPIRSAGGTAQALSVLVADYTRTRLDVGAYRPRDDEVERYAEEVALYDSDTGLQYSPSAAESRFIASHCPICLDGEPTADVEVSGYRDLDRVNTNRPRGGMCLVMAEGIALKAPKIKRYTNTLDDVSWPWLDDLMAGEVGDADDEPDAPAASVPDVGAPVDDTDDDHADRVGGLPVPAPKETYLADLIAGRPVFSHPSRPGGFRLRYGRARNHGFATAGVHPATMHLLDDFLATGTQVKTERPGKAAGVVPVDTIEGPTVRLRTGDVRRIQDVETAIEIRGGVEAILDVGEYLVNVGEFVENNYPLAPASYAPEWWIQELAAAGADADRYRDDPDVDLEDPSPSQALDWADRYDAPLHPRYTYLWHDVDADAVADLVDAVAAGDANDDGLAFPATAERLEVLETLLVPHERTDSGVRLSTWRPFVRTLGFAIDPDDGLEPPSTSLSDLEADHGLAAVNALAPFSIRAKAPTRIGLRMGRPEKSEVRELSPAVHTLFPIGNAGGDQRNVSDATRHSESMEDRPGEVTVDAGQRRCPDCETTTFRFRCPSCEVPTEPHWECHACGNTVPATDDAPPTCRRCDREASVAAAQPIDLESVYREALDRVGERENAFPILKGVKALMSAEKAPEPMEKGILRAKHGVSTFKDGTIRYDMTDLPVTAVRPDELDVGVDQLRELGYDVDIHGDELLHGDQVVPLKVQDIVLSSGAAEHLLNTADFVDDLLESFYGLEPYYEVEEAADLVGELVFGMAPHTSAAVVGRIVGFTDAAVGYAHPYFHAAKRRNCFHPGTEITYRTETGEWTSATIESFVEERLDDPTEDAFGVLATALDGDVRVRSMDEAGTTAIEPVEMVSKHPAPDHLVRIVTEDGRSIRVTPDHEMLRWDGGIERVGAHALAPGDRLPASNDAGTRPGVSEAVATDGGGSSLDTVSRVEITPSDVEFTYCLTVPETHIVSVEQIYVGQCDGDEDCVMLLMDGLLNFSQKFLPEQRGGSVAEDSRLLAVAPDGDVAFLTFDEFWDELESPVIRDGKFRKKACFAEGWRTYVFDDAHQASLKPIEKAIRYPAAADETLLRVETQFGRSIEITGDHSLFRCHDEGIEAVAGHDLEVGDRIVAPGALDLEPVDRIIDVAECVDDPYVVVEDVEARSRTAWEGTPPGREIHRQFGNGLSYRLARDKLQFERFERILSADDGNQVPLEVRIAPQGSQRGIDRFIAVDEEFGWLLGLFVAAGSLSGDRPTIHNANEDLIDHACEVIESTLGIDPATRWSNRASEIRLPTAFADVLYELGFEEADVNDASEQTIPQPILQADCEVICSFLRGFIAGDWSHHSDDNDTTVAFDTTSEDVKDGLVFLLHRLGIVSTISYQGDRPGNRQPIYTVTVSGGADANPLEQVLGGEEPHLRRNVSVPIPEPLMQIRDMGVSGVKQVIPKRLNGREDVSFEKLREIVETLDAKDLPAGARQRLEEVRRIVTGDLSYLRITGIEEVPYDGYLYDLQVGGEPIFTTNWLFAHNSMDAPLVMSTRIDPAEIDDEAHNMDIVEAYPLEFYEATLEMAEPDEIDIALAEETVGTPSEYDAFLHTHDTTNIAAGPDLSAYKTLESMMEKMEAQLELARKLRAVDESDVAERVIESHFLPDLLGNLRAFSSQETRCPECGEKYRRPPLTRSCRVCGGNVILTVHRGSVEKYMETALEVAERFDCPEYTVQRLQLLQRTIESMFEDDHNKQSGIADFM